MKKVLVSLAAAALFSPRPAFAWGCKGHQTVALIAWAHLNPAVQQAVDHILAADPVPVASCGAGVPAVPLIAGIASWPDTLHDGVTGPYHYIDIPLSAKRNEGAAVIAKACNDDCVTFAIAKYSQQLQTAATAKDRASALRFLIHFVGDVHQPLHGVDNADRGGNCVQTNFPGAARPMNLHSDWDSGIISVFSPDPDPAKFAVALDAKFGRKYAHASSNPSDWAWESHDMARKNVYGRLPIKIALDNEPALQSCGARKIPLPLETIDAAYIAQARPVIEQRLDQAGWRLANLLNKLLAASPAS